MPDVAAPASDAPHLVDRRVGLRIRLRRRELGVSQEKLASAIGVTFQQVQKYERGDNRVSASKLWEIARALEVPTAYFFQDAEQGAAPPQASSTAPAIADFLLSPEGDALVRMFPAMRRSHQRKVLELIRALADDEGSGAGKIHRGHEPS